MSESPWINCLNKEPEHGQKCLITRKEKDAPIISAVYDKNKKVFVGRASMALQHSITDTHYWMPIPELPEGE